MTTLSSVTAVRAIKVRPGRRAEMPEHLATEEPMEIRIGGPGQEPEPLAVTMRTPGHDFELAVGFAVTEGITDRTGVASVSYCDAPGRAVRSPADPARSAADPALSPADPGLYNTVSVRLHYPWHPTGPARPFAASASCGVCGKQSIDQIEVSCAGVAPAPPVDAALITLLPDRLRTTQRAFTRTGGLHAAGLFGPDGDLWCGREDVGRHNAVDKVIGATVLDRRIVPTETDAARLLAGSVLMVSGRVSFEIVQKAAVAGIGTIAAVSAPSSLAVAAAERLGVAVLAFVRGETFNVYSHPERVRFDPQG